MSVARSRLAATPEVTVFSLVWALAPLLTFGLATPLVFLLAALRRGSLVQYAVTAAYAAVVVGLLVVAADLERPGQPSVVGGVSIALSLAGTVHALAVRRSVFAPRAEAQHSDPPEHAATTATTAAAGAAGAAGPAAQPVPPSQPAPAGAAGADQDPAGQARRQARDFALHDPERALQMGIGRPDLRRTFDDGGLVDVNHVPAEVLVRLPGITPELAWRIVQIRQQLGPYRSPADLETHAQLPRPLLIQLQEWLLFLR